MRREGEQEARKYGIFIYQVPYGFWSKSIRIDVSDPDGIRTIYDELDVPGAPAVPVIRRLFVIPESDDLTLEVDAEEPETTQSIRVRPYPDYRRDGTGGLEEIVAEDATIYQTDSDFPGEIARIRDVGHLRGQRLALVEFCPVQYNPVRREVKTYSDFHVTLRPQNPQGDLAVNVGPMQNALRSAVAMAPGSQARLSFLFE